MFREFAYGEKYEKREPFQEEDPGAWNLPFGGGIACSGLMANPPAISGAFLPGNLSGYAGSSSIGVPPSNHKIPMPPVKPPAPGLSVSFDDDDDYIEEEEELKEFVKHWWNTQEVSETSEEQLDENIDEFFES